MLGTGNGLNLLLWVPFHLKAYFLYYFAYTFETIKWSKVHVYFDVIYFFNYQSAVYLQDAQPTWIITHCIHKLICPNI